MAKKQTDTVIDLIEMAAADVASLTEEMEEWQSNMEGANMDHVPKYEQVSECVEALQNADLASYAERLVDELSKAQAMGLAFDTQITHTVSTAKRQSRADRLGEACGYLEVALDEVVERLRQLRSDLGFAESDTDVTTDQGAEAQQKADALDDVEAAAEDVRNAWDELLGVEFPGAFGG